MHKLVFGSLAVVALTSACGPGIKVSSSRTAGNYDPKPEDCEIRFEEIPLPEATAQYHEIGQVWLTGTSAVGELTSSQNDLIRPHACKMGGDVVVYGSTVSDNVIFAVLRDSK